MFDTNLVIKSSNGTVEDVTIDNLFNNRTSPEQEVSVIGIAEGGERGKKRNGEHENKVIFYSRFEHHNCGGECEWQC